MDIKCYTKFPDLKAAIDALKNYFKDHNLDPLKSYFKHPIHGKAVSGLVLKLNIERAKILDNYTYRDLANTTKLVKLQYNKKNLNMATKKKTKKTPKEVTASQEVKETKKKSAKKEKKTSTVGTKYDYPLIDGREMTKDEKKKYRANIRKGVSNPLEKVEAKKEDTKPKKSSKKKEVKEETPVKPLKKAKSKKAKKEED